MSKKFLQAGSANFIKAPSKITPYQYPEGEQLMVLIMKSMKEAFNINPRETASFWSIITFRYTFPIFEKGTKKTLDKDDLYSPLKCDRSNLLAHRLQRNWTKQNEVYPKKSAEKYSLLLALFRTFWLEYAKLGILAGICDVLIRISQPYILGLMLGYYNPGSSTTKQDALLYATGIVMLSLCSSFVGGQYRMYGSHLGMKVRVAVCSLIYRKALKLNKASTGDNPVGKIVNLLSTDVSRFDSASLILHNMWICPVSAIIIMSLIFKDVGYAGAAGVIAIIAIVPIQAYLGRLSASYRAKIASRTDERIRILNEMIHGIQLIKMFAWEKSFEKLIEIARNAEIAMLRKGAYTKAIFMAFNLFNNTFALFVTLATMALTNQTITAARVFVFLSYYQMLGKNLSSVFVTGITELSEVYVSIKRLQSFLNSDEYQYEDTMEDHSHVYDEKEIIIWRNVNSTWDESSADLALRNVNLRVKKGDLLGIIGPVGCGKSSLLQTLLGELHIVSGTTNHYGTFSYASQDPWIFADTIQQNILFGSEYDKERYDEIIRVCDLKKDFDHFSDGDRTLLGDSGASMSGGQKARVNLARAVYKEADIYLLDDPLSAVDVNVSKKLYELCINGFLKNKTRILVTHQVHYLKNADNIMILDKGRIESRGSFNELADANQSYSKLLSNSTHTSDDKKSKNNKTELEENSLVRNGQGMNKNTVELAGNGIREKTIQDKNVGSLLYHYISSGMKYSDMVFLFFLMSIAQSSNNLIDWFVSFWTNIEENRIMRQNDIPESYKCWTTETYIYIYGGLVTFCLITTLSRSSLFHKFLLRCSTNSHRSLFDGVLNTSLRFFDANPSGRILNRFSRDITVIDETLPRLLFDASRIFLKMVGHVIVVTYVSPYILILVVALGLIFSHIRSLYLKSSRNLKKLEAKNKSPVFTHLTSTLQGLTTIRAFRAQDILEQEFDTHQDNHTSAWFMLISTSSAFGFALELICLSFIGSLIFGLLGAGDYFELTGPQVGLAISQANALIVNLQFLVRFSADISNQLMSVERVSEYQLLPPEPQREKPKVPSKEWPHAGSINITKMNLRYAENGPQILNDINISIKPNEKVGIIGRTGAGKSSLIAAIFRLATFTGKIEIDDINTEDISLEKLRSKISIIPQDPVLFSGTLRYNIDPFGQYSDFVLLRALDEVQMNVSSNTSDLLSSRVMDRGSNFSVGQRQLICLARAIVRNNKILIMDEATANVDPGTNTLIQETIRRKFANCTVLTIAHRLDTIMDSDRILVMDAGRVAEFDYPYILLRNENGIFHKMVSNAGTIVTEKFSESAERNVIQSKTQLGYN